RGTEFDEWFWRDKEGKWRDYREWLESYRQAAEGISHRQTSLYDQASSGLRIQQEINRNHLRITATIGSYSTVTYVFNEESYHALVIPNSELSANYGFPVLPYKNILFSYPDNRQPISVRIRHQQLETISGLNLVPGAAPLKISSNYRAAENLYFDAEAYEKTAFTPNKLIDFQIVGVGGKPGLLLSLNLLQYNPTSNQGKLVVKLEIDIVFDKTISWNEITADPYDSMFGGSENEGYVIIAPASFVSSIASFAAWKEDIGFNVSVTTIESIYASYAGRDHAEQVRTFINESFHQNSTKYFLLVGDCDIVPTREVWDPYLAGGLDNGTEPSDLYFECLDGDWDANGNSLFGETDDNVDLFPEVMVGRLPVQTSDQARSVCASIIRFERNPMPGSWIDNFLLIGPNCFTYGDGVGMLEGELNQKFLYDSFFDVYRLYPTDGSLSHSAVIDRINAGVNIIDFFDHGNYGGWSDALDASEVLTLVNGNKSFLAYAMACETAAFDAEAYEPTISEAFFRNPDGGAIAYIGATRIAWAGYYAFDGLHNLFWKNFLQTALDERMASPKLALQSALYEMTTTFSMSNPICLETVYQAIYFGDPAMNLYWKHNVTNTASQAEVNEVVQLNGACTMLNNDTPIVDTVNVIVRDPIGRNIYESNPTTDIFGKYTVSFTTNELPGPYTVETTITQPFTYTAINEFYIGNLTVTANLDTQPTYFRDLLFSGTTGKDGTGNASIVDTQGNILESKQFSITGGAYANSLNVTGFGWLRLYVQLTSGGEHGAACIQFQVFRGDVLIISDDTGGYGPDYPGGWVDYNYGDSTNYADYYVALKDEYNLSIYHPRYNCTPSLTFLKSFDAVIVTVGDNFGYPLISPDSFLLDVLLDYHNDGGNLLIEGCRIFTTLSVSPYNESFASLSHTHYFSNVTNVGSLTLENLAHEITSGLPSTISLAADLGTPYADVCIPFNGSVQVSRYYGIYPGYSAIAALPPS
ncbi:MAG: C25 family cysteine peptidase, partial [Promethearchaeota archaeon]